MTFKEWWDSTNVGTAIEFAKAAWEAATKAEREACAKACEAEAVDAAATNEQTDHAYNTALTHAAAAIRARSNQTGNAP